MHGAHAASVGFQVFGPFLKVVARVINEYWEWMGGWGYGWVFEILITTVE